MWLEEALHDLYSVTGDTIREAAKKYGLEESTIRFRLRKRKANLALGKGVCKWFFFLIKAAIMECSVKYVFLKSHVNHDKILIICIFTKRFHSELFFKNLVEAVCITLAKCFCFEFKFFLCSIHQFEVTPICDNSSCCVKNWILRKCIIIKQSNSELWVNFMNRTIARWSLRYR